MNWLEKQILKKIARKLVKQGPRHSDNITEYYRVMQEAATKEFYEDNWYTLKDFLQECHSQAALYTHNAPEYTIHIVDEYDAAFVG